MNTLLQKMNTLNQPTHVRQTLFSADTHILIKLNHLETETFNYRASLIRKQIDQLMMYTSTTVRPARLRPLYGNVYSTGNLRTRSQTRN